MKATAKCRKAVQLNTLPPTENATHEHIKRVYFQVQSWLGNKLAPEQWGWEYKINILMPVSMTQDPAPQKILKALFCNCQKGCAPSSACSCRKSGLFCTEVCTGCHGASCLNFMTVIEDVETVMQQVNTHKHGGHIEHESL